MIARYRLSLGDLCCGICLNMSEPKIRIFKPSGFVKFLFIMNIKLRTAQYGWFICEFMYLRGKYETEYQKKQEYKSKISSISGALFKQEQAPKQKQLQ